MRALVPLDGSPLADGILDRARFMDSAGVELHLMRVLHDTLEPIAQHRARLHLSARRAELLAEGVRVKTLLVAGDAARQILAQVRSGSYDLIAMSTHGRSGLGRWMFGSVAEEVLRRSPVPVLLSNPAGLREDWTPAPFRKILVPLDDTSRSAGIVQRVIPLARMSTAKVVLVYVDVTADAGVEPGSAVAYRRAQERAEEVLEDVVRWLRASAVDRVVVLGRPAQDKAAAILSVAEEVEPDLLAMATHGRSGLDRLRYGSVAERVLREVSAPILIDPSPWRATAGLEALLVELSG